MRRLTTNHNTGVRSMKEKSFTLIELLVITYIPWVQIMAS